MVTCSDSMFLSHSVISSIVRFSKRTEATMESYIMSLIAVANKPGMISFATGLPDKRLFDVKGLKEAAMDVFDEKGGDVLQYSNTEGLLPLRQKIADRCQKELKFKTSPENIFITNGSQECFDHLGKIFLDPGDGLVVENPGYLGALQSFSVYSPEFLGVDLNDDGPDMTQLTEFIKKDPKLFYSIPNHQNPSGVSYSLDSRRHVAELIEGKDCVMVEDDAYGELGFKGRLPPVRSMSDNIILTGSFSKIISPSMRTGWMIVPDETADEVRTSLEAACLHANSFSQAILNRFLEKNDLNAYLRPIRSEYERKCKLMLDLMEDSLPDSLNWNEPEGGMFVWMKTPEGTNAKRLFEAALERKLVIMPGHPFHVRGGENTIRLNYATASDEDLKKGMSILAKACSDVF
jgi:Transcriptional regulators containing a DNA-binding HTH domain and an aminotransferase domain (MocR family) and their eukaryotic orthologs